MVDTLKDMFVNIWPMLFIFTVISVSLRIAYFIYSREKMVIHRELLTLLFIIYILMLYYVVAETDPVSDISKVTFNLVPFREIFRYDLDSPLLIKNVIGNIVLFVPFGLFASYYLRKHKLLPVLIITMITSIAIEGTQRVIGRIFDVDDIILNVTGGLIGYILFIFIHNVNRKLPTWARSDRVRDLIVIILSLLVIAYLLREYIPVIGGR